jgi:diadenosine tetraphosphatase ApaH/serine/threonine PP2A family protein phosphatase
VQAIVSDIHSNAEAFEVVLRDVERHGVTDIISLGDFIGYGPSPKDCVDMALNFNIILKGNHEEALLEEFQGSSFNLKARAAIEWTREQFSMLVDDEGEREKNARRWDFLGSLENIHHEGDVTFAHGTPRDPVREYLYPRDIYRPKKLEEIFEHVRWVCFVGHTHVPGVWTEDMMYLTPEELNFQYKLTNKKTVINVGSTGQPRDGDPRACYVILDGDTVRFRKLAYPLDKTIDKIKRVPELDPFLAERLREGK